MGEHQLGEGRRLGRLLPAVVLLVGLVGAAACGSDDLEVVSGPGPGEQPATGTAGGETFSPDPPATGIPDTIPPSSSSSSSSTSSTSSTTAPGATTTAPDDPGSGGPDGTSAPGGGAGGGATTQGSALSADVAAGDRSVTFVNQRRAENGRHPLASNAELEADAEEWARQMAIDQNMRHDPDRGDKMPGGYGAWGENVAYGYSPAGIDQAWWESEGHRENMLGEQYEAVGIAFVIDQDGTYWAVQIFGG